MRTDGLSAYSAAFNSSDVYHLDCGMHCHDVTISSGKHRGSLCYRVQFKRIESNQYMGSKRVGKKTKMRNSKVQL